MEKEIKQEETIIIFEALIIDKEGKEQHLLIPGRDIIDVGAYIYTETKEVIALNRVGISKLLKKLPRTEITDNKEK